MSATSPPTSPPARGAPDLGAVRALGLTLTLRAARLHQRHARFQLRQAPRPRRHHRWSVWYGVQIRRSRVEAVRRACARARSPSAAPAPPPAPASARRRGPGQVRALRRLCRGARQRRPAAAPIARGAGELAPFLDSRRPRRYGAAQHQPFSGSIECRPRAPRAARASRPSSSSCRISGRRRAASSCSPTTSRWAPAPSIPATTLRALGPKPWSAAYVQPSRRPTDGRYGENPNRLQHYYQFQVILKPAPADSQELYLDSLDAHRHRRQRARHPLRRGRLGKPDARRLGPRLGSLVRRHGGDAVHLFPAGRRHRMRSGLDRDHLRARAAGHVCAGRRERLRPRLQRRRRHAMATCSSAPSANSPPTISSTPTPRCCSGISRMPRRNAARCSSAEAGAAGLRPVHQGEPLLQSARRARRDQRDRARRLYRPRARAGQGLLRSLARERGRAPAEPMPELLLELLTEEIPARMQTRAARGSAPPRRARSSTPPVSLFDDAQSFVDAAPADAGGRRPAGHAARRRARSAEARASARREPAIEGFLQSAGLASLDRMRGARHRQGRVLFRRDPRPGPADRRRCCPSAARRRCRRCPGPNRCAFPAATFRWVRPLHQHPLRSSTARWCRSRSTACRSATRRAAIASSSRRHDPASRDFDDYATSCAPPMSCSTPTSAQRIIAERLEQRGRRARPRR